MQKNFSHLLAVDNISPAEKEYKIHAKAAELKQIAEILKVPAVKDFVASIYVRRQNKSPLIDVWGVVNAQITRQSVISLEYFDKDYEAEFVMQYDVNLTENQVRELEEEGVTDIPDVITNGEIDLCHIAMEQIALELEDYPRQEGENFSFESEFDEDTDKLENPFQILEKLKK